MRLFSTYVPLALLVAVASGKRIFHYLLVAVIGFNLLMSTRCLRQVHELTLRFLLVCGADGSLQRNHSKGRRLYSGCEWLGQHALLRSRASGIRWPSAGYRRKRHQFHRIACQAQVPLYPCLARGHRKGQDESQILANAEGVGGASLAGTRGQSESVSQFIALALSGKQDVPDVRRAASGG